MKVPIRVWITFAIIVVIGIGTGALVFGIMSGCAGSVAGRLELSYQRRSDKRDEYERRSDEFQIVRIQAPSQGDGNEQSKKNGPHGGESIAFA